MAIIISKNGNNAVKVEKSDFQLEDSLQEYIYNNPESIPLYEIKEDIRLLILAREFSTKSGPIDALGVDKDGEIYLVETKLYKNPDKRTVVAQVLDYGASLWSNYRDFSNFVEQVGLHTHKDFNITLAQRLSEFFGIPEEEVATLLENTRKNINSGNFKFVVLMDHLHDQLKDLIVYLNNNSEFTVYAVELEYYKHEDQEILIPKLYGAEVKKDTGTKSVASKVVPTDEEFLNSYQGIPEFEKVRELLELKNMINKNNSEYPNITATKSPKYLNFKANTSLGDTITISLPVDPEAEGGGLQVWAMEKNRIEAERITGEIIPNAERVDYRGQQYGKIARIQLENVGLEQFTDYLLALSKI